MNMYKMISWILALVAIVILLQTLWFKFTHAPESVYIFAQLGVEPHGRIAAGVVELIASIFLLVPATRAWGALLGFCTMVVAILAHLTKIGIVVQDDGGLLFSLALVVACCCATLLFIHAQQFQVLIRLFKKNL